MRDNIKGKVNLYGFKLITLFITEIHRRANLQLKQKAILFIQNEFVTVNYLLYYIII